VNQEQTDHRDRLDHPVPLALMAGMELTATMALMVWMALTVLLALLVHVVLMVCRVPVDQRGQRARKVRQDRPALLDSVWNNSQSTRQVDRN
jgi:hypothetical protein